MKKFFNDLNALHRFTLEIDLHRDKLKCNQCLVGDHFIAHGFIYKKQKNGRKKVVGKRIFCSNRYGRSGCGTTFRLYLTSIVPALKFSTANISSFIHSLLGFSSIQEAYKKATNSEDARNAYRWLNKLYRKLIDYRELLNAPNKDINIQHKFRTKRLKILLPTLQRLFNLAELSSCSHYQTQRQKCFI